MNEFIKFMLMLRTYLIKSLQLTNLIFILSTNLHIKINANRDLMFAHIFNFHILYIFVFENLLF